MTPQRCHRPVLKAVAMTALAVACSSAMAFSTEAPVPSERRVGDLSPSPAASPTTSRPGATLDLRPRAQVGSAIPSEGMIAAAPTGGRSIRIEPIKSIAERGIEASAEALAACQRGPYAGATVSAYSAWTSRSNAQPDHCYRF